MRNSSPGSIFPSRCNTIANCKFQIENLRSGICDSERSEDSGRSPQGTGPFSLVGELLPRGYTILSQQSALDKVLYPAI